MDADERALRRLQVIHDVQLRRRLLRQLRSRWGWWWKRNPAKLKGMGK